MFETPKNIAEEYQKELKNDMKNSLPVIEKYMEQFKENPVRFSSVNYHRIPKSFCEDMSQNFVDNFKWKYDRERTPSEVYQETIKYESYEFEFWDWTTTVTLFT